MNGFLILRTLGFLVVVPGVVAGAVPLLLLWLAGDATTMSLGAFRYAGLIIMGLTAPIYARCAFELAREGGGLPAPVEPTRFLVHSGLYRYTRNPMYLTGSLFLLGEAIALEQAILLGYAALTWLLQHLAVVFLEERALRRRFGAPYEDYCRQVPRWIPIPRLRGGAHRG